MNRVSVVIPCYNSENTISMVVHDVVNVLEGKYEYEIILVNDGSTKELWNIIKSLVDEFAGRVKGIRFAKNFGQHAALMAAYRASNGDVIIQMDDDGQCKPTGIYTLLEKIEEGYDVVYARYKEAKKSAFRRFGSEINRQMSISLINMPKDIHPNSFCAYTRSVINEMIKYDKPYPYVGGLVYRATTNICDVEIEHLERASGTSNYSLKKLIKLWMNGFTAFSVKPLEITSMAGTVIACIGMIYAIFIIISKILGYKFMTGWSSLMALTLLLDGFIMIVMGLLGEYIGRIYICLNNTPQYFIRDEYGDTYLEEK